MTRIPYWRSTNIRRRLRNFSRHGDLEPRTHKYLNLQKLDQHNRCPDRNLNGCLLYIKLCLDFVFIFIIIHLTSVLERQSLTSDSLYSVFLLFYMFFIVQRIR